MSLDSQLWEAKQRVTSALMDAVSAPQPDVQAIATAVDALNKAWDELTSRLIAQREERGDEVLRLLDLLSERRER